MAGDLNVLRVLATFADFSGGEYGTIGGRTAPQHTYNAMNMVRYRTGNLGPRAGLHALTPTGLPAGVAYSLAWPRAYGEYAYVVMGNTVYKFAANIDAPAATALTGNLNSTPARIVDHTVASSKLYLTSYNDATYEVNLALDTVTRLTGTNGAAPGGRAICVYGDRMVVGGISGAPARFFYSEAADYTNWPSTNFIDVSGENIEIRGLYPMRDFLVIVGADQSIYVLTGVPGANEQLRRIVSYPRGNVPSGEHQPTRGALDLASARVWMTGQHLAVPVRFNGARIENASNLEFGDLLNTDTLPPPYGATAIQEPEEVLLIGRGKGIIRREAAWSRVDFDQEVSGLCIGSFTGEVLLSDGGSATAAPGFWIWNTNDDQAPVKSGGYRARTEIGDGSNTAPDAWVKFPEAWPDPDLLHDLHMVLVDGISYRTGVAQTNHFGLTVYGFGTDRERVGEQLASDLQVWEEPPARSSTTGSRRTLRFPIRGLPAVRGFQVAMTGIRGFEIERVLVVGKSRPHPWT